MPEASSFPIFLRATMPQVQSPDTAEGLGCGRLRVYLATQCEVLESKADMQKRGQASPDDGDALALTFTQPVAPAEVEEEAEEEEFGGTLAAATLGGCDSATWQSKHDFLEYSHAGCMVNRWPQWSTWPGWLTGAAL
jgi:hypothetical protein